jgi:hypothetical protein
MAFNIDNATDVVVNKSDRVLVEAVKDVQAHSIIGMESDVKGAARRPDILTDGTVFKEGDFDGTNDGGVKIEDVLFENALFTSEEKYQVAKLESTIIKLSKKRGVNPDDFPIEDAVLDIKKNDISRQYDKAVFLGDSADTGKTLSHFVDGLVKKIKASAALNVDAPTALVNVKRSGVAASAFAAGTVIAKVLAFVNKFKSTFNGVDDLARDLDGEMISVYISPSQFQIWFQATYGTAGVINANTLNNGKLPKEAMHPSFNGDVKMVAVDGMKGSNEMFAGMPENFNEVVDGDAESDFMTMHFSKDQEAFLLHTAMRLGTKIIHLQDVLLQVV